MDFESPSRFPSCPSAPQAPVLVSRPFISLSCPEITIAASFSRASKRAHLCVGRMLTLSPPRRGGRWQPTFSRGRCDRPGAPGATGTADSPFPSARGLSRENSLALRESASPSLFRFKNRSVFNLCELALAARYRFRGPGVKRTLCVSRCEYYPYFIYWQVNEKWEATKVACKFARESLL